MRRRAVVVAGVLVGFAAQSSQAGDPNDEVFVLGDTGRLLAMDIETGEHRFIRSTVAGADERLDAIVTRALDHRLVGIRDDRLYAVDRATGDATPLAPPRSGAPRIHVPSLAWDIGAWSVTSILLREGVPPAPSPAGAFRLWLDGGTGVARTSRWVESETAPDLVYADGDPGAGSVPHLGPLAYWTGERAYAIDFQRGTLVRIGPVVGTDPPDTTPEHVVRTVGTLSGVPEPFTVTALEIRYGGPALALAKTGAQGYPDVSRTLYTLDLETAVLTPRQTLPIALDAIDLAMAPRNDHDPLLAQTVTGAEMRIRLGSDSTRRDTARIGGTLPIPADGWGGKTVGIEFGGQGDEFVLDAAGRGRSGQSRIRMARRPSRNGEFAFVLDLRGKTLREGVVERDGTPIRSGSTEEELNVFFEGDVRRATVEFWFRKRGRLTVARRLQRN